MTADSLNPKRPDARLDRAARSRLRQLCAAGILQSKAGEALLGKAGRVATTRNRATTLKLHALATEVDA